MVIELSGVQFGLMIRVISKAIEFAAQVQFEITSMISDQNCTTRSSITTFSYTSILKSYNLIAQSIAGLYNGGTGNAFTSHFVCRKCNSKKKIECDVEQKMVRFRAKMRLRAELVRFVTKSHR